MIKGRLLLLYSIKKTGRNISRWDKFKNKKKYPNEPFNMLDFPIFSQDIGTPEILLIRIYFKNGANLLINSKINTKNHIAVIESAFELTGSVK